MSSPHSPCGLGPGVSAGVASALCRLPPRRWIACIGLFRGELPTEVEQEVCGFRGGAGRADDGPIILADDVQPGTEVIGVPDGRHDAERGADEGAPHLGDQLFAPIFFRTERASLIAVEPARSEEHTSELQSLLRNSSAVFCLKK